MNSLNMEEVIALSPYWMKLWGDRKDSP